MRVATRLFHALPLGCLLLVAGAEDDCPIQVIVDDGDEPDVRPEECDNTPPIAPVCPAGTIATFDPDDADCGAWSCTQNEDACSDDSDCPNGTVCQIYRQGVDCEDANVGGNDGSDEAAPEAPPCESYGLCVAPDPSHYGCESAYCDDGSECVEDDWGNAQCIPQSVAECASDSDCGDGGRCTSNDGDCLENPDCDSTRPCTDECWGYCIWPGESGCWSDDECGEGQRCEPADCGSDEYGAPYPCDWFDEPPPGTCVAEDSDDCLAALCAPDTVCVDTDDGALCIPVSTCATDEDCEAGTCEVINDCAADPGCPMCAVCYELRQCVEADA